VSTDQEPRMDLRELLALEMPSADRFVGESRQGPRGRLFGGHVAAQALMAAGRTVDGVASAEQRPHSLHAYFLDAGAPNVPIEYAVERVREGRSFVTRIVRASQAGRPIFTVTCSFHRDEPGPTHQVPMPDVPPPESCIDLEAYLALRRTRIAKPETRFADTTRPIDLRPIAPPEPGEPDPGGTTQRFWVRALGELPDDPLLHACIATWASDYTLLGAMRRPHGGGPGYGRRDLATASLDHALWLHKTFRMDQWLLYDQVSPLTSGGRGLSQGRYYTQGGELVASMCQEGLLRVFDPAKAKPRANKPGA
jgi:acyl-CoA thioesterase-2